MKIIAWLISWITEGSQREKIPAVAGLGLADAQCSCSCEVRCESALITNRAESETHTAYIIEEHIVDEEVVLKHEISLTWTSHSLRESISWFVLKLQRGACSSSLLKYKSSVNNAVFVRDARDHKDLEVCLCKPRSKSCSTCTSIYFLQRRIISWKSFLKKII